MMAPLSETGLAGRAGPGAGPGPGLVPPGGAPGGGGGLRGGPPGGPDALDIAGAAAAEPPGELDLRVVMSLFIAVN